MAFEKKKIEIKIEAFEGPLDLLLNLIAREEVAISEIPIMKITDQYLEIMSEMQELDLELTTEFLVMAATLLEIKSKMLLPDSGDEEAFDFDGQDPRAELIQRLVTYKAFKEASLALQKSEGHLDEVVMKGQEELSPYTKSLSNEELNASLEEDLLVAAVKRLIQKINRFDENRKAFFNRIRRDKFTVEEKIDFLNEQLASKAQFTFSELFGDAKTKEEVVVTFLALLELLKLKVICIDQPRLFDELTIQRRVESVEV
ncbi:segregation and condensation protein A [Fusibacter sp. JL298sf-3]